MAAVEVSEASPVWDFIGNEVSIVDEGAELDEGELSLS